MPVLAPERRAVLVSISQAWGRDAELGLNNLLVHRTRSLLTMLGMMIGVGSANVGIGADVTVELSDGGDAGVTSVFSSWGACIG